MDLELTGRVAIVTGASKGIGLACARALAGEGCDVALVARTESELQDAARRVAVESGRRAVAIPADTGDDASVTAMAARAADELGPVSILVNAAATPNTGGFPESELESQLNVKLGGALRCARAVAPGMAQRGFGRIVNISGLAARQTGSVVGSVRNVAVAAMTKNLADELGGSGVNVTCVHPGLTRTERTPAEVDAAHVSIGRIPTADEVASVVAFLASPRSVAINGDAIAAGGGTRGPIFY